MIRDYHRALCLYSFEYRGTEKRPGLIFGLDKSGICRGMAFRVAETYSAETVAYLWEREMVTHVYLPRWLNGKLADGRQALVLAFVRDTNHEQYAGRLDDETAIKNVLQGKGKRGRCLEYLQNTLDHLDEMGIHNTTLTRIVQRTEHGIDRQG